MKCSICQSDNREGVKFCEQCGAKFEIECPNCRSKIPATVKFCGECGHNLAKVSAPSPQDLSFDDKLAKIQKYLPEGLTEKILSQRNKIEGERRQVTVLFCDMESSTSLIERLGPEQAYAIMDQVYEIMIHKVHDFEGTVNEMTGDGILALFGAPIAIENAAQRESSEKAISPAAKRGPSPTANEYSFSPLVCLIITSPSPSPGAMAAAKLKPLQSGDT